VVREVFAHEAVVAMEGDSDPAAPGGAITVALCGSWDLDRPCPLAPHHTAAERDGDVVRLRILFAAAPADEPAVRQRIAAALTSAELVTPTGATARWQLISAAPAEVHPAEAAHARRLAAN
jgi:hypothetical protein